jgi:hypothetical protein
MLNGNGMDRSHESTDSRVLSLTAQPQGLPETHFLLLRRSLHQLQRSHHRALPYIQDTHLALRH